MDNDWFYKGEEFQLYFKSSGRSLVIKANPPHFTMLAASDNYLALVHKQRSELLDKHIFEVFPGSAADPSEKYSVFSSFNRVIHTKEKDVLPIFKYEIFVPKTGKMETEYWSNINEPIPDEEGNVAYLINTTTNVTQEVLNKQALEEADKQKEVLLREQVLNEELAATVEELRATNEELHHTQESLYKLNAELEDRVAARTIAIIEREEKLRLAIETGKMATWSINPLTYKITMSDYIKEIFGIPIETDVQMEAIMQAVHPEYRQLLTDVLSNAMLHYKPTDIEYPITNYKTGETKWVRVTGKVFFNAQGKISEYSGLLMDITEQVNAKEYLKNKFEQEQELNEELAAANEEQITINEELQQAQNDLFLLNKQLTESEQRFRFLVQQAPVAIFILHSRKLVIEVMNDLMLKMLGKTADIIGKTYMEALPELEGQPFFQLLDDVFTSGEPFYGNEILAKIEYNGQLTDGYFNFIYQPVKNNRGITHSVICVSVDITDQVKARKKVEQAEESLRIATESAELGTWYLHSETFDFIISPRFKQIFGFEFTETPSYQQAFSYIHPDYQQSVANAVQDSIKKGVPLNVSYPLIKYYNGKEKWVRSIGKPIHAEDSSGIYITGVIADITEQKLDEQRKNDFIGMVSHELKTPLTSMSAYLQLLQMKAKKSEDGFTASMLDKANKQVTKMTTLVNGFLNVSRLEAGKIQIDKQRFNMAELVRETEEENISTISSHHLIFEPVEITFVNADRDKISQVISNLISNAVKYSPANSTIQLACVTDNGMAQVSVKDEGIGIQPEDKEKLFERYYRVKDNKTQSIAGFGIGLYLCAEIIQRHDGRIWVESEWGKGSTFYFTLPVIV